MTTLPLLDLVPGRTRLGDDLDAVLDGVEGLGDAGVAGLASSDAEGELGDEGPRLGDAEELLDGGLDGGDVLAVVLEVGADAVGREGRPDNVLGDTVGVGRPGGDVGGKGGRAVDELLDALGVLEEDDGAVARRVGVVKLLLEAGLGGLGEELLLRGPDGVPELLVLVAEDDDGARGLSVERRGRVLDRLLDNLLDVGVRDGEGLVGEAVVRAAGLGGVLGGDEEGRSPKDR